MEKSLVDIAYDYLSTHGKASFNEIWSHVKKEAELTDAEAENKVSRFYTNMLLDARFAARKENEWDLRDNYKFEEVHIDMGEVYESMDADSASGDKEETDDTENKEYNKPFESPKDGENNDPVSDIEPEENI